MKCLSEKVVAHRQQRVLLASLWPFTSAVSAGATNRSLAKHPAGSIILTTPPHAGSGASRSRACRVRPKHRPFASSLKESGLCCLLCLNILSPHDTPTTYCYTLTLHHTPPTISGYQ